MDAKQKGILYSILAALFIGLGYIPAKNAMGYGSLAAVNFFWYFPQIICFAVIFYFLRKKINPLDKLKSNWRGIILVGSSSAVGAFMWFWEIENAGILNTAFILQFTNLFAVILGAVVLKEKFNSRELAGGALAIAGAFVFSFHNPDLALPMFLVLLFNAVVFAVSNLWAKITVKNIDSVSLSAGRATVMAIPFFLVMALNGELNLNYPPEFWVNSLIGSALSVSGFIFFYKAFSLIEVSKAQLGRTPEPIFAAIFSYALLGNEPSMFQIIGGVLIVLGVGLLIYAKPKQRA